MTTHLGFLAVRRVRAAQLRLHVRPPHRRPRLFSDPLLRVCATPRRTSASNSRAVQQHSRAAQGATSKDGMHGVKSASVGMSDRSRQPRTHDQCVGPADLRCASCPGSKASCPCWHCQFSVYAVSRPRIGPRRCPAASRCALSLHHLATVLNRVQRTQDVDAAHTKPGISKRSPRYLTTLIQTTSMRQQRRLPCWARQRGLQSPPLMIRRQLCATLQLTLARMV